MKEVVRLLQSLPFHQAREAKDQVFRCWEAGALATGHQLRIVVFSGILILFTNSFLLIKLKYEQLWPLGKDVLEGKYAVGLRMACLSGLFCHVVIPYPWALFFL